MKEKKKILVINFGGGYGDFILLTPVLNNLYQNDNYRIVLLANASCKNLIKNYKWFARVIFIKYSARFTGKIFQLLRVYAVFLFKIHAHICITPVHGTSRLSRLLAKATRTPRRVGFAAEKMTDIFTDVILENDQESDLEQNLKILDVLGERCTTKKTSLSVPIEIKDTVNLFLTNADVDPSKPIIAMAPLNKGMKGFPSKNWGLEKYLELARRIIGISDAYVFLLGSRDELKTIREHYRAALSAGIYLQSDIFSVSEAGAILERSSLLICNDGGLMHMAVALNVPVLSIWGITTPHRWGYVKKKIFFAVWKDNCECAKHYLKTPTTCLDQKCFASISVDDVFSVYKKCAAVTIRTAKPLGK